MDGFAMILLSRACATGRCCTAVKGAGERLVRESRSGARTREVSSLSDINAGVASTNRPPIVRSEPLCGSLDASASDVASELQTQPAARLHR